MISVIVPIYNSETYLKDCLESILGQTYRDWECILVDDGSADGSPDLIDSYCSLDSRLRAIHQDNHGVSYARNVGIDHACGEYVTFVDSDDWIEGQYLERLYETISGHDADLSICGLQQVFSDGRKKKFHVKDDSFPLDAGHEAEFVSLNRSSLLFGPVVKLYRTDLLRDFRNVRFEEGCSFGEDLIFNYRYLEHVDSVAVVSDILYNYRIANSGSLSRINDESRFEKEYSQWHILMDFFKKKGYSSKLSRDFLFGRLWGIVYDGLFRFPGFQKKRIDYLKRVLSIPEISNLKGYGDPACSKWIKYLILNRMYRSFYLYFKIAG
jgi:glycosyltransferase involved in cell wall biosynthesis